MSDPRLLPCPFCGCADIDPEGVAFYPDGDPGRGIHYTPACTACDATAGTTLQDWNRRVPCFAICREGDVLILESETPLTLAHHAEITHALEKLPNGVKAFVIPHPLRVVRIETAR